MKHRLHMKNERGSALFLAAASMLFLMGFTAIVVDGGTGFTERRQAQSGVDFASLAALQEAVSCPSPCTVQAAVDNGAAEAMARVAGNLPGRVLDWSVGMCDDPGRPAKFIHVASTTDCVSFTENLEESRVMLPHDTIETTFGRVLGIDTMTVRVAAEAKQDVETSAAVIPLTIGGAGPDVCLYSNQAPQTVPPCDGPSSGNFGYLDIALYGNAELGTPSTCTGGTANDRIAINVIIGSDHNITQYVSPDPVINDHATCPNRSEDINELEVKTGSPKNGITKGMIEGTPAFIDGEPIAPAEGRLECNSTAANASVECRNNIRGLNLDHTGLWEFLAPGKCPAAVTSETHTEMADCLNGWNAGTDGVIFTEAIAAHPRFAAVPIFASYPANGTSAAYKIVDFVPVWIETIFSDCNSNKCDTVHSPGEPHPTGPPACPDPLAPGTWNCGWNDNSGPTNVEALTAFKLDLDMLPLSISEDFPGRKGNRNFALVK